MFLVALSRLNGVAMATEHDMQLPGIPAPLMGTLTLPASGDHVPGVLIVAGSGPTDRNGNQPGMMNDAYRKLADGLAACGIASLRTDKRGIAMSAAAEPDESNLAVETYVRDTLAWLDLMRRTPRIATVSVIGHSEGALIGSIAAHRTPLTHLVLIAGTARRASDLLRAQLSRIDMAPRMRTLSERMIGALERGETIDDVPKGLAVLFRPSVQPYLISEFKLDPVAELAKSHVPALIVQGTNDIQVSIADGETLARARSGANLAVIDGMNHVMRIVAGRAEANLAAYADTQTPLAPSLLPLLCRFLSSAG